MGLILSNNNALNNKLFTDHLNSVRFIDDTKTSINQENRLKKYEWPFILQMDNGLGA